MVKIVLLLFICAISSFANDFDNKCIQCHTTNAPELENLYFRYIQIYSSQKRAKIAMKNYLTNPKQENSIMPAQALQRFGIHQKVEISVVEEALDRYFEIYDIKKRIRLNK